MLVITRFRNIHETSEPRMARSAAARKQNARIIMDNLLGIWRAGRPRFIRED
jgi:hypothetical protein